MSKQEVDDYLARLDPVSALPSSRFDDRSSAAVPDAEEGLSYGAPTFKVGGKAVAGFAAAKNHLSYLPHSGSVLTALADEVAGYKTSKGALTFASRLTTAERPRDQARAGTPGEARRWPSSRAAHPVAWVAPSDRDAIDRPPTTSEDLTRQLAGLLHPGGELGLVELVVLVDVEVAHVLVLGLAGRDRTQ